jgi:hypothetical protein
MPAEPPALDDLLATQSGVISRAQCIALGMSTDDIRNLVRYGRWQRFQWGIYATFTGAPARESHLWAALLRAGPGATFSHQTAAELYGLISKPSPVIHVTVPADRHPTRQATIPGVRIHRSTGLSRTRHPTLSPPRTRIEDTVLDLMMAAADFAESYDWICRGIGKRLTTAERLRAALDERAKFPQRRTAELALADADEGALSNLELWYVRGVERAHGLPVATRQAQVRQDTGRRYLDNLYEKYRLCVEIDGTAAHPAYEQWRDKRRDRWNLVHEKLVTMRLGYRDLHDTQSRCRTAAEVATALSDHGPPVGRPCADPDCPVRQPS